MPVAWRCAECGGGLLLPPAEAARRRFCGRDCVHAWQRRAMAEGQHPLPRGHTTEAGRQKSLANLRLGPDASRDYWSTVPHGWQKCLECTQDFPTRAHPPPLYCSEACRQRMVSRQKRYMITAACLVCGRDFLTSKYRPKRTCSRRCGKTLSWAEKRACAS
jgi:predicted nucleic acid-binding Zn ribbon protein